MEKDEIRIDKWLWAVRVFKTRSQATEACRVGKILIHDIPVKPSREVHVGDEIFIKFHGYSRTLRVIGILTNRVSAKFVPDFAVELTLPEEFEKAKRIYLLNLEQRARGLGRPTKKERRDLERFIE